MKTVIVLALALTSSLAFANSPKIFTGKYVVQMGSNCDLDPDSRAYVRMEKDKNGNTNVRMDVYGDEARILDVPASSRVTKEDLFRGSVTRTVTVKWTNPTTMKSKSVTKGSNYNQPIQYTIENSLSLKGKVLTIVEMKDGREDFSCDFVKK